MFGSGPDEGVEALSPTFTSEGNQDTNCIMEENGEPNTESSVIWLNILPSGFSDLAGGSRDRRKDGEAL